MVCVFFASWLTERRHVDLARVAAQGCRRCNSAAEEFYVLDAYGDLQAKLWAAEALVDRAGQRIEELLHAERESVGARSRGEVEVLVAAAKQRSSTPGWRSPTASSR